MDIKPDKVSLMKMNRSYDDLWNEMNKKVKKVKIYWYIVPLTNFYWITILELHDY